MNFSYLLELAKDNDASNKIQASVNRFSTKVSKPKKISKAAPSLEAIKAVLDRKEEAKQKENEEFRRKKENLLALRAQDRKSNKRVKAMINRNKGASKAVLDDAKDLTTAKGEEQCDEDDYGYESTMSQHIFNKLANQYAKMPEDNKLKFVKNSGKASIADIKSRVISTLKKEEEEESTPKKRKRKSKQQTEFDDFINDGDEYLYGGAPSKGELNNSSSSSSSQKIVNVNLTNYKSDKYNNFKYETDKEKDKESERHKSQGGSEKHKKHKEKKKSKAMPPPMSFEELLKVAQKKHKEPVPDIKKEEKKEKEKEKQKDVGRPLTAKEKEELEDEKRRKLKRMGKWPQDKKDVKAKETEQKVDSDDSQKMRKNGEKSKKLESSSKLQQALEKPKTEPKVVDRSKYFAVPAGQKVRDPPQFKEPKPPQNSKPVVSKAPKAPEKYTPSKDIKYQKPRDYPPKDIKPLKPQKFSPKGKVRDFPPPDMQRRPTYTPTPKRRIESDSEEEYDSEMDDFIDDGEQEMDFSNEIKKLFGYDRSKYMDDDDDCDDMEASYSQMQKEEKISAKIGLQEDLEDIRREEEEKKRKAMRLKQMKKSRR